MNKLIVDKENFSKVELKNFNKVYLVGYAKDDIEELLQLKMEYNIEVVLPSDNFDTAYYAINNFIAQKTKDDLELLSLFKLCKEELFNMGMLVIAYEKVIETSKDEILVVSSFAYIIKQVNLLPNVVFKPIKKSFSFKKLMVFKWFAIYLKALFLTIRGMFTTSQKTDVLLIDYEVERILGPVHRDLNNTVLIRHGNFGKFITLKSFISFTKYQIAFLKMIIKFKMFHKYAHIQANYFLQIFSLIDYYKPKTLLGVLDSQSYADIYAFVLKDKNIQFGCYSHSFNYDFRVDYIYIPFDYYFVWSQRHLEQIRKGQLLNSDCEFYITGCPFYDTEIINNIKKEETKKYDILVVGEYYYNDYSKQPFNSLATKELATVLSEYTESLKICVRPRFTWDGYLDNMKVILKDNVTYSIPVEQKVSTTILEDILSSKVIIGVFSGAAHDSLLMNTPVIQVNFIGIKDPKRLAEDKFVYQAGNAEELKSIINDFFNNRLPELDYQAHNNLYINNGHFEVDKIISEIKERFICVE